MSESDVSIIVSTLDRAVDLGRLLASLRHLDYDRFEVIVVNGPSRDGTDELLAQWAGQIKLASCRTANLAASRNIGLGAASGDIVAFIDDDAVPHPRWLQHLVAAFGDRRLGGVGGFTLDGSGVRFQVRKTLCDRFGNAEFVSDWFDERPLCVSGTPWYPSLLGTNAAFRRSVLAEVNGFDETFAYFLDETDLCLRIIDRGYRIVYEPAALVFHHFAASRLRDARRILRSRYRIALSKAYFLNRHGWPAGPARIADELHAYERAGLAEDAGLMEDEKISPQHRYSLEQDLHLGIAHGVALAAERRGTRSGAWQAPITSPEFRQFERPCDRLAICMISHDYPPAQEAGIARWTATAAEGLAARGHRVHVVTRTTGDESIVFDGRIWLHSCRIDEQGAHAVAERYRLPYDIAAWCARAYREVQLLKGYGLDLVSFRIWDLEGLPCLDDPDFATVVSLDATFGLLQPFKPEWSARPIFSHLAVDKMIAAERDCLARAPILLANSAAIIADLERCYSLDLAASAVIVPHGTPALAPVAARLHEERGHEERRRSDRLKVLYVGRFEFLKGIDLALRAAEQLIVEGVDVEFAFAGGHREDARLFGEFALAAGDDRLRFLGPASRERVQQLYLDCDVVLMPSRYESFGLVAIEAMAAGKPVIALNAGGLREIVVPDGNGWLIAPGEAAASELATAIRRLAREPETLARLARGARTSFTAQFTADRMAERIEDVFRAAVAGRRQVGAPVGPLPALTSAVPIMAAESAADG
jgi:glycosyltransferase involved in cell wall biosynthesis/GT2 family glycosyltransferase